MAGRFKIFNGPQPTTAALASVATGTSIKTMLQLRAMTGKGMLVTGWGYSLDTEQDAAGTIELVKTNVAATVTAHAASGIVPMHPTPGSSVASLSTTATGYTATAEGSITSATVYDAVKVGVSTSASPQMLYTRRFDKDERFFFSSGILRVRATMGKDTGMICWITWLEK